MMTLWLKQQLTWQQGQGAAAWMPGVARGCRGSRAQEVTWLLRCARWQSKRHLALPENKVCLAGQLLSGPLGACWLG